MITKLLTLLLLLFFLESCFPGLRISRLNRSITGLNRINLEPKGVYPEPVINYFIKKLKAPDKIGITNGIELYRVSYYTQDEDNKQILVSGLMAVPRNKQIKGVVSYQHGTNNDRHDAPSSPSKMEGLGIAAIFAGGGYLCLLPDYIGFGVSNEVHTYLHTTTTVNAVIDLLRIGSDICKGFTGKEINNLFLTGVSQGGHATAGAHRFIEKNPIPGLHLVASSSIAGAYNLKEVSIPYAIENNSVYYLGYLANSYCHIYRQPPGSILEAPFDTLVPVLFDGNHSYEQIRDQLPKTADLLYRKELLNGFKSGQPDWFTDRLAENETFNWKPIARFRIYYGFKDTDVSPADAVNAYNNMAGPEGDVQLIGLGDLNHLQTAYSALPKTRVYFDSLTYIQQKMIKQE